MAKRHGVEVVKCGSPREALEGADIIVTAGPIRPKGGRVIEPDWLKPGSLLVALDYDSYLKPETLHRASAVYTDDVPQLVHLKDYGYFNGAPERLFEIGDVLAGKRQGRTSDDQTIVSINMGIALEDVTLARKLYDMLSAAGSGLRLEL
jgi:ornithine cyclodeaminase/alanine dehydrogenase